MRVLCFAMLVVFCAGPVWANARITVLMEALRIMDVVEILREEGFAYADDLEADMLGGEGGAFWASQVRQIYERDAIVERVRRALEEGLDADDVEAALAIFTSGDGRRIITLENAARRAMADPDVDRSARDIFQSRKDTEDPLMLLVSRYITENDLLERNVSGAMSANYQFYKGLSDGKYLVQSEEQIVAEVWSQQEEIRTDTEAWLNGFLLMAYEPLPLGTVEAYVDYSDTKEGQALNAALFEGFESVYRDISYALGRAIALNAEGDEI